MLVIKTMLVKQIKRPHSWWIMPPINCEIGDGGSYCFTHLILYYSKDTFYGITIRKVLVKVQSITISGLRVPYFQTNLYLRWFSITSFSACACVCVRANLNMFEHNPYMFVILGCTLQKFGTFSGSSFYSLLVGFIESLHPLMGWWRVETSNQKSCSNVAILAHCGGCQFHIFQTRISIYNIIV